MPELYDEVTKKTYKLDDIDEIYIGRGVPEGHLITLGELRGVSRRHARVFRDKDRFWVENSGQFGTWVDEKEISSPTELKDGSRIDLAKIDYYSIIYYREKRPDSEMGDSGLLELKDEQKELTDDEFFEKFGQEDQ